MNSTRRGFCGIILLAASLALLGCGDGTVFYVRSVNASNGLKGYTVQVGVTGIVASLPYGTEGVQPKGQYSTTDTSGNYRELGAGANQKVTVYTTPGSTPLASETQSFLKNTYYTVVTLAQAPSITLRTLADGDTAPPSGDFKVRMLQASTTSGPVDVYFTASGANVSGTPAISNLQFGQVTQQYYSEAAGTVEIQITPAGNPSTILYSGVATVTAGANYTAYFLDPPSINGVSPAIFGLLLVKDPVLAASTTSSTTGS